MGAVDMLAQAREELIGLRETTVWASLFPSETLTTMAPSHALAGGRRRETEQHVPGVKGELYPVVTGRRSTTLIRVKHVARSVAVSSDQCGTPSGVRTDV